MTRRVFVSAGEPSGDLHGSAVVRELKAQIPGVEIEAFGGPQIERAGARILWPMERYTVMGFAEILHKIPAHYRLLRALTARFRAARYDLIILIDYPGFHLRVAEAAHRAGVKVLYYIAPQLWAWGPGRAGRFRAAVDRFAVIFPFEAPFFQGLGMDAQYVGHPLLDRPFPSRADARRALSLPPDARVLGLFPGSRPQEVRRHWRAFGDAGRALLAARRCDAAVVAATTAADYPRPEPLMLARGDPHLVLAAADAVLAKSGTTTLEAALADTPMVVAYRVHLLTELFARRLIRVRWVSLVNLIADAPVVEELLQREVSAPKLAAAIADLLDPSHPRAVAQRAAFGRVRDALGGPGAAARVAGMAAELMA